MTEKFWIIQHIQQLLEHIGVGPGLSALITFIAACALLVGLIWLIDFVGTRLLMGFLHAFIKRSATKWDDFLYHRRFFNRLIRLLAVIAVQASVGVIFKGYDPKVISETRSLINIVLTWIVTLLVCAFLNAANDIYETKPQAHRKSIKGYIQSAKIVIYVISSIITLSVLLGKSPNDLLIAMGASAAIITLVFKDTILGFVASIQLSAQDMVRPGDWIEMPSKNADGVVTDINVNSVKVRNWNNTVTMVPIYSMVSESFTNWRNMQESDGRRFKRQLLLDVGSIRVFTEAEAETLYAHGAIAPYAAKMAALAAEENPSPFMTNLRLFHAYIEAFAAAHPLIDQRQPFAVKYVTQSEHGLTLELYGFSIRKDLIPYEKVVSGIYENLLAVAPLFGLGIFQRVGIAETVRAGGATGQETRRTS
ncbi:MAG: mechanosensitive ion channel family protein [Rikenellaceae bacterium]|nr:mechanosensitive ion channel family protein [Rikenellaceae bacterium]